MRTRSFQPPTYLQFVDDPTVLDVGRLQCGRWDLQDDPLAAVLLQVHHHIEPEDVSIEAAGRIEVVDDQDEAKLTCPNHRSSPSSH
jgi:hypothetical protein